ncbi:hypothetical protein [Ekhidna sp.]|uniref:hypothetical protein n=1 Tax=Ekhidna sp. TaxID=2608089 RepID=UPI003299F0FF
MQIKSGNWIIIIVFITVAYIATAVTIDDWTLGIFSSRHDHDGLYISHQRVLGFSQAWIIRGSNIRVIQNGTEHSRYIRQGDDYIRVNNSAVTNDFYKNDEGEFVLLDNEVEFFGTTMDVGVRMKKVREETDYTVNEVMMLLDSVYED